MVGLLFYYLLFIIMSKDRYKMLLRYGNFIIEGRVDVVGRMTHIIVRTSSGNWKMRIGDDTFMFGLIKSISLMNPGKEERKIWDGYMHSVLNIIYQFGVSGIPVEIMRGIYDLVNENNNKSVKSSRKTNAKDEKAALAELRTDEEMKQELINLDKDGSKKI